MSAATGLLLEVLREPERARTLDAHAWDLVLRQALAANLLAALAWWLEPLGAEALPPGPRRHLGWARRHALRHRDGVRYEVRKLGQALAPLGVRLVLLKGAAYTAAGLPLGWGRLYGDVDILVPQARLSEVEAALMLNGWHMELDDPYDQHYYRTWMHELPPMRHIRRDSSVDVHHAILPRTARVCPDPDLLLADARAASALEQAWVLAPADQVLHSAAHLFSEGELEHGLRDLFDLHRLLGHYAGEDGEFWAALVGRATVLGLERYLYYALRACRQHLGTAVPARVTEALAGAAPGAPQRALMDWLFGHALLPHHASSRRAGRGLALFLLYVRGNWLRMPMRLLLPHLLRKALRRRPAEGGNDAV